MPKLHKYIPTNVQQYGEKASTLLTSKKGQAYTTIILSFFTMAFFGFFAIKPTLTTIAKLHRQIEDKKTIDKKLTEKIISLMQVQEDFNLISGAIPALNAALPSSPEIIKLLSIIERSAVSTQATISSLTVQEVILSTQSSTMAVSVGEPATIPFTIGIRGNFEQIQRFIALLVSSPRIVKVESIDLSPSGKEGLVTIEVSAQTKAFYYQQPEKLNAIKNQLDFPENQATSSGQKGE